MDYFDNLDQDEYTIPGDGMLRNVAILRLCQDAICELNIEHLRKAVEVYDQYIKHAEAKASSARIPSVAYANLQWDYVRRNQLKLYVQLYDNDLLCRAAEENLAKLKHFIAKQN